MITHKAKLRRLAFMSVSLPPDRPQGPRTTTLGFPPAGPDHNYVGTMPASAKRKGKIPTDLTPNHVKHELWLNHRFHLRRFRGFYRFLRAGARSITTRSPARVTMAPASVRRKRGSPACANAAMKASSLPSS